MNVSSNSTGRNNYNGTELYKSDYDDGIPSPIFDHFPIKLTFILLYTTVFIFCVVGNLTVLVVIGLQWKTRSVMRFCMWNLALANLCVGFFCIYQNLSTFLAESWNLGAGLCKMYSFVNGLSHTASILILVVVCVERYLSLVRPVQFRRVLTIQRVRLSLLGVWLLSALLCSPRFYYVTAFETPSGKDPSVLHTVCAPNRKLYDSKLVDMANFLVLFLIPLVTMILLYTRIGLAVWNTSAVLDSEIKFQVTRSPVAPNNSVAEDTLNGVGSKAQIFCVQVEDQGTRRFFTDERSGGKLLRSRKSVIRMLVAIVMTFAVCNFPYHLRKICQYYVPNYDYDSLTSQIVTPVTFLLMYANCAINPILYGFMSKSFRVSLCEILRRRFNKGLREQSNKNKRVSF